MTQHVVFPDAGAGAVLHPDGVHLFVVERYLVGWSTAEVSELLRRTSEHAATMAADGVRHLASVFIPSDETCLCMFEGPDPDTVRLVNERHQLPLGRVVAGELTTAGALRG